MFKKERLFAELHRPWFSFFEKPCCNSSLEYCETSLCPYLFDEIKLMQKVCVQNLFYR